MINWILHILIDALVLLLAARIMPKVEMRSFGTSLMVAFAVGILSVLIGWLLEFVLNVVQLTFNLELTRDEDLFILSKQKNEEVKL